MRTEVTLDRSHELTEDDLWEVVANKPTQLDRIESKLDELLARKKRVVKAKGSKESAYSANFEAFWSVYPKVAGANKAKACAAYNARMNEAGTVEIGRMTDGAERYAAFIKATGRYVMLPATFLGPSKHYECDWTIPAGAIKSQIPKDNEEMQRWAIKKGLRAANQGESWPQYRAYVENEA